MVDVAGEIEPAARAHRNNEKQTPSLAQFIESKTGDTRSDTRRELFGAQYKQSKETQKMNGTKPWYLSKTIITSGIAFIVAVVTAAGVIDVETGVKFEALLVPLIFTFLRLGDTPVE